MKPDLIGHPYPHPEMDIMQALDAMAPEDGTSDWFAPVPGPTCTPVGDGAGPIDTRQPGATLTRAIPRAAAPPIEVLERFRAALSKPSAAEELARLKFAGLVYGAARNAEPPYGPYCEDCKATVADRCEACDRAQEKSAGLYKLHDLILAADSFATAVRLFTQWALPSLAMHAEGGAR